MYTLGNLLEKFKKNINKEIQVKKEIKEIISGVLGVEIQDRDIDIKNKELIFRNPHTKSAYNLQKNKIDSKLKEKNLILNIK